MNSLSLQQPAVAAASADADRPSLAELSIWIRLLFVGASAAVVGVVSLVNEHALSTPMLGLVAAGCALTVGALMRTRSILRVLSV